MAQNSQDGVQKHIVAKGETVYQIAKQYQITPFDIYRLNPDAKEGIQENTTLLIPKSGTNTQQVNQVSGDVKKHTVQTKETLYSIAKKYEVSVADLKEWNEAELKDGLKIGQEIIVSVNYAPSNSDYVEVKEIKTTSTVSSHVVKMQETKFGIAKKYNISIEELSIQIETIGDASFCYKFVTSTVVVLYGKYIIESGVTVTILDGVRVVGPFTLENSFLDNEFTLGKSVEIAKKQVEKLKSLKHR